MRVDALVGLAGVQAQPSLKGCGAVLHACSGAVLAGGRSLRFVDGCVWSDKALAKWRGKTLLEQALQGLGGCAERFVVGGDELRYGFTEVPIYPDPVPHQGNLHGLSRALGLGQQSRVCVTACDMPGLSAAYWSFMAGIDGDVVIPINAKALFEPLAAIYSKSCLPAVQLALAANRLKMTAWWAGTGLRVQPVPWSVIERRFGSGVFLNVNSPNDLP